MLSVQLFCVKKQFVIFLSIKISCKSKVSYYYVKMKQNCKLIFYLLLFVIANNCETIQCCASVGFGNIDISEDGTGGHGTSTMGM